jgi:hypothetical protein
LWKNRGPRGGQGASWFLEQERGWRAPPPANRRAARDLRSVHAPRPRPSDRPPTARTRIKTSSP